MEPIVDEKTKRKSTAFAFGAGHIRPNCAMDPGLVYDLTSNDFLDLLCARGYNNTAVRLFSDKPFKCPETFDIANFNYPSIVVTNLGSKFVTVTRNVKNVGNPGTYTARIKSPSGVSVSVNPKRLAFDRVYEEKKFEIVFKARDCNNVKPKDYAFGRLIWSDGKHCPKSPIVVLFSK